MPEKKGHLRAKNAGFEELARLILSWYFDDVRAYPLCLQHKRGWTNLSYFAPGFVIDRHARQSQHVCSRNDARQCDVCASAPKTHGDLLCGLCGFGNVALIVVFQN